MAVTLKVPKVIVLGEPCIGKSALINKAVKDIEGKDQVSIKPCDFKSTTVYHGNDDIRMVMWDSHSIERARMVEPEYLRRCDVVILAYDTTQMDSFENIPKLAKLVRKNRGDNCFLVLAGTRADLQEKRCVSNGQGQVLSQKIGADFFIETSAMAGNSVNTLLELIDSLDVRA